MKEAQFSNMMVRMNKLISLPLLMLILLVSTLYPNTTSPSTHNEPHLIKAIVLYPGDESLLEISTQGVQAIGIKIPGDEKSLSLALQPFLEQELSNATIQNIKQTIYKYYQKNGHPLVLISVPSQSTNNGLLKLQISESRLGDIRVEGNKHFSSTRLKKYIRLKPGDTVDESVLVKNLNLINRNPFRHADILYSPGTETNTTDVILRVNDRSPYRFYAGADNTGVKTTGRTRLFTGFNWGNALLLDHIFAYQYTTSVDFHKFQAHSGQYIAPLFWGDVLNIFGGYSTVHADLETFKLGLSSGEVKTQTMKSHGFFGQASIRYMIPFLLNRYLLHDIVLGFDFKRTNNTVEFSDDLPVFGKNVNLTQFILGYLGNYDRDSFRIDFQTNLYFSPGKLVSDQSNNTFQSLIPKAKNQWVYWHSEIIYLQKLPKDASIRIKGVGQLSSQNLLPSEQLGLGGYDTIRGYDQRAANKENGIILSAELRSPSMPIWSKLKHVPKDSFQVLAFLDYGYGRNQFSYTNSTSEVKEPKNVWLMGIGPGFRYTLDPYFTARLDWGFKLHKDDTVGRRKNFVNFSLTASY